MPTVRELRDITDIVHRRNLILTFLSGHFKDASRRFQRLLVVASGSGILRYYVSQTKVYQISLLSLNSAPASTVELTLRIYFVRLSAFFAARVIDFSRFFQYNRTSAKRRAAGKGGFLEERT
jgi:hypothetical protein